MTQEDKDLLIKDLCSRLPYGVKYSCTDIKNVWRLKTIFTRSDNSVFCDGCNALELCRPYLFPLSSMTEEQKTSHNFLKHSAYASPIKLIDFYNKNHFDYRSLIPKGLAIDCTNLNIY